MMTGVTYRYIDDKGLHIVHDGEQKVLDVDSIVVCAGQLSEAGLAGAVHNSNKQVHVIGGAYEARELDAESAIRQGAELAATL